MTAIGVAVIRARESARTDRLYDDPLAQWFVDAAREGFTAERWERVDALSGQFYEGRTVGVRLVDDRVREAVGQGIRQIVLIGAGLDTRAFRMEWPAQTRIFEVDLPETFGFKEPVLRKAEARPRCERQVVAVDLRDEWAETLIAQGFRVDQPTLWVDEGVLGYLSAEEALRAAAIITELSAPGSNFGAGRFTTEVNSGRYAELHRLVSGDDAPPRLPGGLGPDIEVWFDENGWSTEFFGWDDLVAAIDRPEAAVHDPGVGFIRAVRR
ncbi:SAM-dependent methyltransferase [Nocardia uniformis]|uniref:S-adenosyl-L-methionine-dependent methyltransferase n=2 Tax=Nocardia uniformis TaxID=53432 RepID=A0A849C1F9_9NOCA|nr:SAM-dependent methyltransferase [Nocardia uniformis]